MIGLAKQKVPGGKLISIKLEYNGKINKISILGDFFLHPEAYLAKIEAGLVGTGVDESVLQIADKIGRIVEQNKIQMIGITPESIAQTIKMAMLK